MKGQKSRAGGGTRPGFEGGQNPIYRRMPYKRGFHNKFAITYEVINLDKLALIDANGPITPESLFATGVVSARNKPIKILGDGELTSAIHVRAHKFSESARTKIEAAGGTVEVIGGTDESDAAAEDAD